MKVQINKIQEINEIKTAFGTLEERNDKFMTLSHDLFKITFRFDEENKETIIYIKYKIFRPCHDHDNSPTIELHIPEGGALDCECGKHQEVNNQLIIETDAGHLNLETFFKNYVWEKKARFYIPYCCWSGKDAEQT